MNYIYIALILFFIIGLYYITKYLYNSFINKHNRTFIENNEFKIDNVSKNDIIYLFYVDWCPHSRETLDVWETIVTDESFKYFNFIKIDCEDNKNSDIMKKFNIKEFPTIIFVKDNKKYIFNAKLTKSKLKLFLTNVYK
tara:strand:+ start:6235 stop:6651 length:417 start_codon:yes stop_codon:yes gene_type:complete